MSRHLLDIGKRNREIEAWVRLGGAIRNNPMELRKKEYFLSGAHPPIRTATEQVGGEDNARTDAGRVVAIVGLFRDALARTAVACRC